MFSLYQRSFMLTAPLFSLTLLVLCLGIASYALVLPLLNIGGPIHARLFSLPLPFFYLHTVGGALALCLVPSQLWLANQRALRSHYSRLHKMGGKLYVAAVATSCIGGYYLAMNAYGGLVSTIALTTLCTFWWISTGLGVVYICKGEIARHRRWMIRSLALTTSAITLRLMSPPLYALTDLYTAQQIIYWTCWPFNLLVAETYLRLKNWA